MFKFFKKNQPPPHGRIDNAIPSIWIGSYRSYDEWQESKPSIAAFESITDSIDDKILPSRREVPLRAWCAACRKPTMMRFRWYFSTIGQDGAVNPPWTETPNCDECLLNSRMRAVISLVDTIGLSSESNFYMTEAITDGYKHFSKIFPKTIGSEYFGSDRPSGSKFNSRDFGLVLHEDLTRLSFKEKSFDAVIAQEVFEHIPNYSKALLECRRVLKESGRLIFTIPFSHNNLETKIRAKIDAAGEIQHILPAEYHGNPVDSSGSLCFQNFGWDILDELRRAGFRDAIAHMYWGPWQGHFGAFNFVFEGIATD